MIRLAANFRKGIGRTALAGGVVLLLTIGGGAAMAETTPKPVAASPDELRLSAQLRDREKALLAKEEALARRSAELAELEKRVGEELARLIKLQEELKLKLAELTAVKDKNFKELIKIYSTMSASKVAPLLNQMDDADALEILRGLKADQVAQIIPKLNQAKAVRLSRMLGLM